MIIAFAPLKHIGMTLELEAKKFTLNRSRIYVFGTVGLFDKSQLRSHFMKSSWQ